MARAALAVLLLAAAPTVASAQVSWARTTVKQAVAACSQGYAGVEPVLAAARASGWPEFEVEAPRGVNEYSTIRHNPGKTGPAFYSLQAMIRDENDLGLKSRHMVCVFGASLGDGKDFVEELAVLYPGYAGGEWWGLRRADGKIEAIDLVPFLVEVRRGNRILQPGERIIHVQVQDAEPGPGDVPFGSVRFYELLP